jgi:hypothetical protein
MSGVFSHYKYDPSRRTPHLTNNQTLSLISQTIYSNIQKFSYFFKMRHDLNFHPTDEENYTAEEPNGSSFLAEIFLNQIFLNYGQTNFYQNQIQNTILNFSQGGYYPNYPYDSSIYPYPYIFIYSNNIIYQQSNPAVQPCYIYNFFWR